MQFTTYRTRVVISPPSFLCGGGGASLYDAIVQMLLPTCCSAPRRTDSWSCLFCRWEARNPLTFTRTTDLTTADTIFAAQQSLLRLESARLVPPAASYQSVLEKLLLATDFTAAQWLRKVADEIVLLAAGQNHPSTVHIRQGSHFLPHFLQRLETFYESIRDFLLSGPGRSGNPLRGPMAETLRHVAFAFQTGLEQFHSSSKRDAKLRSGWGEMVRRLLIGAHGMDRLRRGEHLLRILGRSYLPIAAVGDDPELTGRIREALAVGILLPLPPMPADHDAEDIPIVNARKQVACLCLALEGDDIMSQQALLSPGVQLPASLNRGRLLDCLAKCWHSYQERDESRHPGNLVGLLWQGISMSSTVKRLQDFLAFVMAPVAEKCDKEDLGGRVAANINDLWTRSQGAFAFPNDEDSFGTVGAGVDGFFDWEARPELCPLWQRDNDYATRELVLTDMSAWLLRWLRQSVKLKETEDLVDEWEGQRAVTLSVPPDHPALEMLSAEVELFSDYRLWESGMLGSEAEGVEALAGRIRGRRRFAVQGRNANTPATEERDTYDDDDDDSSEVMRVRECDVVAARGQESPLGSPTPPRAHLNVDVDLTMEESQDEELDHRWWGRMGDTDSSAASPSQSRKRLEPTGTRASPPAAKRQCRL